MELGKKWSQEEIGKPMEKINSNCIGQWERPIRVGNFNNTEKGGEIARVESSTRQEEMRVST